MFYTVKMLQIPCFPFLVGGGGGGKRQLPDPVANAFIPFRDTHSWMPSSGCERAQETKTGRQRWTLNREAIDTCASLAVMGYSTSTTKAGMCGKRCILMSFSVLGGVLVVKERTCITWCRQDMTTHCTVSTKFLSFPEGNHSSDLIWICILSCAAVLQKTSYCLTQPTG